MRHILANPDLVLTQLESYSELPDALKQEVRQLLSGMQDPRLGGGVEERFHLESFYLLVAL